MICLEKERGGRKEVWKGEKDGGKGRRREEGKASIHSDFRMVLCVEVERSETMKED